VTSLQAAKAAHDKAYRLVFPTAGCRPKLNFWDDLKAVAERSGREPAEFWIHKFRATFATTLISAADFGEQSQYFKVQPHESDHQREAAVPFHVFRGSGTGSTLDKIEIQH
jgi:hypothetical protein